MNQGPLVIYSSAPRPLAFGIADVLHATALRSELKRFNLGEFRVQLPASVAGRQVVVVQPLSPPSEKHLMELAQLCNAAKILGAQQVTAVIPWLAYSLQDRSFRKGEPVSAKIVAGMIDTFSLDTVMLIDVHSPRILKYFKTPLEHVTHADVFASSLAVYVNTQTLFVSPDEGAKHRVKDLAKRFSSKTLFLTKHRDRQTGTVTISDPNISLQGVSCIICDDLMVTGDTLIQASRLLLLHGAREVIAAVTHPLLIKEAISRISGSGLKRLLVSDTVSNPRLANIKQLEVVSCAAPIAMRLRTMITT